MLPEAALENLVNQVDASMGRVRAAYESTYGTLDYKTPKHVNQYESEPKANDGWTVKKVN